MTDRGKLYFLCLIDPSVVSSKGTVPNRSGCRVEQFKWPSGWGGAAAGRVTSTIRRASPGRVPNSRVPARVGTPLLWARELRPERAPRIDYACGSLTGCAPVTIVACSRDSAATARIRGPRTRSGPAKPDRAQNSSNSAATDLSAWAAHTGSRYQQYTLPARAGEDGRLIPARTNVSNRH
jgi:hypothetical protein